jgi:hypothetical protein
MPTVGETHHVKIGSKYFIVMPGSYRKRLAPAFGPRFTTGDPDYSNLTFWQHWVQSCWIGGFGAETWTDDSMFDQGAGVDGTQHEVLVLSRDLGPSNLTTRSNDNWTVGATTYEREFVEFNSLLYLVVYGGSTDSKLFKYDETNNQWDLVHTFNQPIRSVAVFGGRLWFGDDGANMTYMTTAESFSTFAKPAGRTEIPYAMMVFRDRLYVPFGRYLWRMKPDFSWDGSTVFYEAVGVDRIECMEQHQGFLYLGSLNGRILRSDGNATFDLWQFDPGPQVLAMRSYDGRLFVMTNELQIATNARAGVLYQFTGSAVTELKRWGSPGLHTATRKMRVLFRRLYFGASNLLGYQAGFGIASYDAAEDAYHIFATNRDESTFTGGTGGVNRVVDDIAYWKGKVFCSVRGFGVFYTALTFKDVSRATSTYDTTPAGVSAGAKNGGWVESSDFDAGTPGLLKYFRQLVLHVDLPDASTSVYIEVSYDGGQNWEHIGTAEKSTSATRYRLFYSLQEKSTRIKYRITLRTTDTAYSPQVRAIDISYLPMPDPTWQWEMTLGLFSSPELLDGTVDEAVDPEVDAAYLEAAARAGIPVAFTDLDGTNWSSGANGGVLIQQFEKDVPIRTEDDEGPIESFIRITLLEAFSAAIELT